MKTINGKVEFLAIPAFNHEIYGRKCHRLKLSTTESDDVTELRKNNEWFYLTESTEEQASLLVDYDNDDNYKDYTVARSCFQLKTAKESLFSLLKTNGCWIKGWKEKPLHIFSDSPHEETSIQYQDYCKRIGYADTPDDYLLIIKQ